MVSQCDCKASLHKESDPERYNLFVRIMGCDPPEVPLKGPVIQSAIGPGEKPGLFYLGDPDKLTDDQKKRMISILSGKFNIPPEIIEISLSMGIFPINAEHVTVSICTFHMNLILGYDVAAFHHFNDEKYEDEFYDSDDLN